MVTSEPELLALTWQDLDPASGTLRIERSIQPVRGLGLRVQDVKSLSSRRTLHLPQSVLGALAEHRRLQDSERIAAGSL
jgi:integrase